MSHPLDDILKILEQANHLSAGDRARVEETLKKQQRDLNIESSLENVRTIALSMNQPADMLEICKTISKELATLGVQEIRNVQTALFHEERGTYFNFEYYAKHDKCIFTETEYRNHPLHNEFAERMLKGAGEVFIHTIGRAELPDWIKYQKTTNVFIDSFLESAPSLTYYWYSLGAVALGLSTYEPLKGEEVELFKRFKNVFELAYRRFLDIQQAEAQAKAAKLEASLEKVRAQVMAMHATDDLKYAGEVIFHELKSLGFADVRNTEIIINLNEKETVLSHYYSDYGVSGTIEVDYRTNPVVKKWADEMNSGSDAFTSIIIPENDIAAWRKYREELGYPPDPKLDAASSVYYYSYSTGLGALSVSSFTPISDEQMKILERFRNVFALAYRRYVDVSLAEAQAREAQIEAALEKVRSSALAMHRSDDFLTTAIEVNHALNALGVHPLRSGLSVVVDESKMTWEAWSVTRGHHEEEIPTYARFTSEVHWVSKRIFENWKKQEPYWQIDLSGDDLKSFVNSMPRNYVPMDPATGRLPSEVDHIVFHYFSFPRGVVFAGADHAFSDEEISIMKRFARVFDFAYRRYLDLQQAEQQAREAQIEASLERVRASAMAMHNSDDLTGAAGTVFTELNKLGIHSIRSGFVLLTTESRRAKLYPATSFDKAITLSFTGEFDFIGHPVFEKQYESWLKQENYFPVLEGETLISYYRLLSEALSVSFDQYLKSDKQYGCFLPFTDGFLFTWNMVPVSEEEIGILSRFKTILDLTIRRYTDLKKAEALAEQSLIEGRKLREEKERADQLLLNILPEEIANELKQFGKSYARKHEEVTILFADIKGFSSIAETLSAQELVTQLDECFRAFDHIVDKHGLEKIKTVGDAYVCAAGLPKYFADHAAKAVSVALDMMNFIKGFSITRTIQDLPAFEFRIGIHTGPVITGVVGLKKFTYDIWGDAVNLAARMEQHGEAGKINISESTYGLVKDKFTCVPRGKISAKNKGEVEMYFVEAYSSL